MVKPSSARKFLLHLRSQVHNFRLATGIVIASVVLGGVATGLLHWHREQLREEAAQVNRLLQIDPVSGLILAIHTIGQDESRWFGNPTPAIETSLLRAVQISRERNRFELGHQVYAVTFSADGQTIAAAGEGATVRLWNKQGSPVSNLQTGISPIQALTFSADGQMLIGTPLSNAGTMQLWDVLKGTPYPSAAQNGVTATGFSADDAMGVSGNVAGRVYLWNRQGEAIANLTPSHLAKVTAVAFANSTIASSSEDGTIHLWNDKGEFLGQLWAGKGAASLQIRHQGQEIVSQSVDSIQAFRWDSSNAQWTPIVLSQGNHAADLSPDSTLIARGEENKIKFLPLNLPAYPVRFPIFTGHTAAVTSVAFSPDGSLLLSGSEDSSVRLWDTRESNLITQYQIQDWNNQTPALVAMSIEGQRIAIGTLDGSIRLRDIKNNLIHQLIPSERSQILNMAFSPEGDYLAVYRVRNSADLSTGEVEVWDLNENKVLFSTPWKESLSHLALSTKGNHLAVLEHTGAMYVWDRQGNLLGQSIASASSIHPQWIAFDPEGQYLVAVGKNNTGGETCLWKLSENRLTQQSCHAVVSQAIAFAPQGQTVAIAAENNTILRWDLKADKISTSGKTDQTTISTLAYSPDGSKLVSGSAEGTVQLLTAEGQPIGLPFVGHWGRVQAVGFEPGGKTIISLSQTGEIRLWQGSWQGWLQVACERLRDHPALQQAVTATARSARSVCQREVWSAKNPANLIPSSPQPSAQSSPQSRAAEVRVVVKLAERRVYVYQGDAVQASYPVAIGKAGWETPTGSFKVIQMEKDPSWTHPFTKEVIPPDAANNPLGDRWIAFWTDGQATIGFHGTPDADSVGQPASHGCIRMYKNDVHTLYEVVKLGTTVTVEP